jgi:hypothetical protein
MWHVWGRGEAHTGLWWGNLTEGDHLEDPGIDGRIILNGSCEYGDEPSSCIKYGELLE